MTLLLNTPLAPQHGGVEARFATTPSGGRIYTHCVSGLVICDFFLFTFHTPWPVSLYYICIILHYYDYYYYYYYSHRLRWTVTYRKHNNNIMVLIIIIIIIMQYNTYI